MVMPPQVLYILIPVGVFAALSCFLAYRRGKRAVAEGLPNSEPVSVYQVSSHLEKCEYYWRQVRWNKWGLTTAYNVPETDEQDYIAFAGTGAQRLGLLLMCDVLPGESTDKLVGRPGWGYNTVRKFLSMGERDLCPAEPKWKGHLIIGKDMPQSALPAYEETIRALFQQVADASLPKPLFIEVSGANALFVFPLQNVLDNLEALTALCVSLRRPS